MTRPMRHNPRPAGAHGGKPGIDHFEGLSMETTGSAGIHMHILTIPPGGRAKAHKHATHETAIYQLTGQAAMYCGARLEHPMDTVAGDLIYIPADRPHLPFNTAIAVVTAVIARTDPHEQDSVVLLPDLEALVD